MRKNLATVLLIAGLSGSASAGGICLATDYQLLKDQARVSEANRERMLQDYCAFGAFAAVGKNDPLHPEWSIECQKEQEKMLTALELAGDKERVERAKTRCDLKTGRVS